MANPSSIPVTGANVGPYTGPALFAGSFRIFFLSAAIWAVLALVLWIYYLAGGGATFDGQLPMLNWHAHELVYGYGGAVVAGFAFTAIPNWTGRTPVRGVELGLLFAFWFMARVLAVLLLFGWHVDLLRAVAEIGFFLLFVMLAAREVVQGKNWRNMKIIVFFSLLLIAALFANLKRQEVFVSDVPGWQAGLFVLLLLICVIGGRIIPAFTRNWMKGEGVATEPTLFNKFDAVAIAAALVTFIAFSSGLSGAALVTLAASTAVLHLVRLLRWRGWYSHYSPIVFVLHVSYAWVPIGFALLALAEAGFLDIVTALHAWAVGGMGSTTLAVMTRASLGHTGQPLTNSIGLTSIYLAINGGAVCRIFAALWGEQYQLLLNVSGVLWCAAFLLFVIKFLPTFLRP